MVRPHRQSRGRPRLARKLRQGDSFSLLELVVVISVLATLAAISLPFFQSLIKQAAYVAGQWSLSSATTTCSANKSLPIPTGFFGTQFSSSNSSDICNGSMTATFDGGCQISIDLESGEKSSSGNPGWPNSIDSCFIRHAEVEDVIAKGENTRSDIDPMIEPEKAGTTDSLPAQSELSLAIQASTQGPACDSPGIVRNSLQYLELVEGGLHCECPEYFTYERTFVEVSASRFHWHKREKLHGATLKCIDSSGNTTISYSIPNTDPEDRNNRSAYANNEAWQQYKNWINQGGWDGKVYRSELHPSSDGTEVDSELLKRERMDPSDLFAP